MTEHEERTAFERMLAARIAQLTDLAGAYTSKLSAADREAFLSSTIELAWTERKSFDPVREQIGNWWDSLCQRTAESRKWWTVQTITGPKRVEGKLLHRWGRGKFGSDFE